MPSSQAQVTQPEDSGVLKKDTAMTQIFIGNRGGIPIVTVTPAVSTADVRFKLPSYYRWPGAKGKIILQLTAPIPTGTTGTLPLLVEHNGETRPLANATGAGLTAADATATMVFEIFYDRSLNTLMVTSTLT